VSLLPMAIGEGTFSLVVGGLPLSVFSRLLPSALTGGPSADLRAGGLRGCDGPRWHRAALPVVLESDPHDGRGRARTPVEGP